MREKEKLTEDCPQREEEDEQKKEGGAPVAAPTPGYEQAQQEHGKEEEQALGEGEYQAVGQDADRIPGIGALGQPGEIPEPQDERPEVEGEGAHQEKGPELLPGIPG